MNIFLVLALSLCFSPFLALKTSSFLGENQNASNISVVDVKVSHSNNTGLSSFIISCSSVPTQVAIVTASQNDIDFSTQMINYFDLSRVLKQLGESSLYIDYRYYRVYAKVSNSGSNTNISVDLPTKHSPNEYLTAIAWCMDNSSQSSRYRVGPYGPFNNSGVPLTIKVTYLRPLKAEEVELQTKIIASFFNLSSYTAYDHFGTRLYPNMNEEKAFYIPKSNEYNTYLDIDYFQAQDSSYSRLSNALNETNLKKTIIAFSYKQLDQNFTAYVTNMTVTPSTYITANLAQRGSSSTSNSININIGTFYTGKYASYLTRDEQMLDHVSWLSFWNGEDLYGNPLPNFRMIECNYAVETKVLSYSGLDSGALYFFQYYMNHVEPFLDPTELIFGETQISTQFNQATMLGAQILVLFLMVLFFIK